MNIGEDFKVEDIDLSGNLSLADKWILTRLNETIETVTNLSENMNLVKLDVLYITFGMNSVIGILK